MRLLFHWFMYSFAGLVKHIHAIVIPRQRKLMGSSAQNSSGVHWCRRRARFNEVPEKVPERFRIKFRRRSGSLWCRSGSTGFRRRFRRRSGRLWCRARSGVGGFGAKPGVSTGFWRRFRRLWCRARSGSTGFRRFRRRFQEALVHSQVRFNGFRRRLQKLSQVRFI